VRGRVAIAETEPLTSRSRDKGYARLVARLAVRRARSADTRGQFETARNGNGPPWSSRSSRSFSFRNVLGECASPRLAVSAVAGWELVSDRLDRAHPLERVGIVAAVCCLLRPSKSAGDRGAMPVSGATDGSCPLRAHSVAGAVFTDGSARSVLRRRAGRGSGRHRGGWRRAAGVLAGPAELRQARPAAC
jgi:hypothetical protein